MSSKIRNHYHNFENHSFYQCLLFWANAFVKQRCRNCRKTKEYKSWKEALRNLKDPAFQPNEYSCADLAISGIKSYENKDYRIAMKHLKRSNNIFPNSIIQLVLASSYGELEEYSTAKKILKNLLRPYAWRDITMYLHSCCVDQFYGDLHGTANKLLIECLKCCLLKRIKSKWVIQYENCYQYDLENYNFLNRKEQVISLAKLARSKFWNNKYKESLKYVKIICELCMEHLIALNHHQSRLCYIILFYMNQHQLFEQFYRQQTFMSLLMPSEICTCTGEVCDTRLRKMKIDNSFALYMKAVTNVSLLDENLIMDTLMYNGAPEYDIRPVIALYYRSLGQYKLANRIFCVSALMVIRAIEHPETKEPCVPLCLGVWFASIIHSMYAHYQLRDFKMAKYFYQITLKINKNDGLTHYHFGILLRKMGKLELSEKHFKKAKEFREINNMMSEDLVKDSYIEKMHVFDICNCCGLKKCDGMKKCSRCKSVYYCSKSCQKYDWNNKGHKEVCESKGKLSLYEKARSYLQRFWIIPVIEENQI